MNKEEFIEHLNKLGVNTNKDILEKLEIYCEFLKEYNAHTNLTAITNEEDIYLKHFYDSLTVVKVCDLNNNLKVLDIGSGAGFPGIVLKIFFPNIELTTLDSNNKKTKFMEELANKLDIDINVINIRAEDYAKDHLNSFDIVTSRAVAFIDIIASLAIPYIKKEGKVILLKGNFAEEKEILDKHYQELNIEKYEINSFNLPMTNDERNIVVLSKNSNSVEIKNYAQILKQSKKWRS